MIIAEFCLGVQHSRGYLKQSRSWHGEPFLSSGQICLAQVQKHSPWKSCMLKSCIVQEFNQWKNIMTSLLQQHMCSAIEMRSLFAGSKSGGLMPSLPKTRSFCSSLTKAWGVQQTCVAAIIKLGAPAGEDKEPPQHCSRVQGNSSLFWVKVTRRTISQPDCLQRNTRQRNSWGLIKMAVQVTCQSITSDRVLNCRSRSVSYPPPWTERLEHQ